MRVQSLHIYPVKGVRGVSVDSAQVKARGFEHDRRWLVVDDNNRFITQRENQRLATIDAAIIGNGLHLLSPNAGEAEVATPKNGERVSVVIWRDEVDALTVDAEINGWLSEALKQKVRLVFMDDAASRNTSGHWGAAAPVSFADGYPFLITTTGSLATLNKAIEDGGSDAVGMERFRPNIVINDDKPWADDGWSVVQIGDALFDYVKPCVRCVVTTKDQQTGETMGKEPLASLTKIRMSAHPDLNGALFGWNAFAQKEGAVCVGDKITVIEERTGGWPIKAL